MSKKKKKLGGSDTKFAMLLLSPSILLLALLIGYPLIYNIVISCQDVPLNPNLPSEFIGLQNYIEVFKDPEFYKSVLVTLSFTVVVTGISTLLGLILSIFLNRPFFGKKLVNSIISTAKNTAYNSLRGKEQEILWEDQEELADPAPMPEEHILAQEDLYRLARVWLDLDKKTQYLLSAKSILKKSGKEIASDLNMPPDNVRMALVRARRKARQAMEQKLI